MLMEEKKHVLLEDEESDWLQICTAAATLDAKGNKQLVFLANRLVIPDTVTYIALDEPS